MERDRPLYEVLLRSENLLNDVAFHSNLNHLNADLIVMDEADELLLDPKNGPALHKLRQKRKPILAFSGSSSGLSRENRFFNEMSV